MLGAKTLLVALLVAILIPNSLQIVVECEYQISHGWRLIADPANDPYGCYIKKTINVNSKTSVTSATGQHYYDNDESGVVALSIYEGVCEVIPSGFGSVFPNVEFFQIWNAQLKTVSSADIQQFTKLREIWLYMNELKYLESNLFEYNKNVEYINFKSNKIKYIGGNFFENLPNLQQATFYYNPCTSSEANNAAELENVKEEIRQKCSLKGAGAEIGDSAETIDSVPEKGSCLIPHDIPSKVKVFYEADTNQELAKGSYVSEYSNVIYKCDSKYILEQNTTNFCLGGKWTIKHPDCLKYCSPVPLSGVTIKASCEIFGESASCQYPQRPNSTAHITCAVGYRKPDQPVTDVLHCDDDGEWDYHAFRCEPICGLEAPTVVPYIVGGERVNITKVPWHVAIFSDIFGKGTFTQICGGTIINAKLVISAAHCFWDISESRLYEPSNFKVGAGKYYRDFVAIEPAKPQIVDVAQIKTKQEYNDYAGYYAIDIALLILVDHLKFNLYIKPICLETNLNFNEKNVQPGLVGKVAGWGLETSGGESSPELKYIELPAIEYNECKQKLSAELQLFITGDKFCAGYTTGQSVCRGDSGGGLVFPKTVGSSTVYFLRGIVSTGGNKGGSCDNDQYTLFTNVQLHIDMVQFYESQNRPK